MLEYMPEVWTAFEMVLQRSSRVTEAELDLLGFVRRETRGVAIDLSIIEDRRCMTDAIPGIAGRQLRVLATQL